MFEDDRSGLEYRRLVNRARHLGRGQGKQLKIGLLADVSTQHLEPLLRVLFHDQGFDADIYEAGFDTIELEAYNPASGLFEFRPDVVMIVRSVQKLKSAYYEAAVDRAQFGSVFAERQEDIWRSIQARLPVPIIQTNFPLPYERQFGNFDLEIPTSLLGAVAETNRELTLRARLQPSVLLFDMDYLAAWFGRRHFFDEKLWGPSKTSVPWNCFLMWPRTLRTLPSHPSEAPSNASSWISTTRSGAAWSATTAWSGSDLGDLDTGGVLPPSNSTCANRAPRGHSRRMQQEQRGHRRAESSTKHPGNGAQGGATSRSSSPIGRTRPQTSGRSARS